MIYILLSFPLNSSMIPRMFYCDVCTPGYTVVIITNTNNSLPVHHSLATPVIPHEGEGYVCVSFYYHMDGINMGSLTLYLSDSTRFVRSVWAHAGHAGKEWIGVELTIYVWGDMLVCRNEMKTGHISPCRYHLYWIFVHDIYRYYLFLQETPYVKYSCCTKAVQHIFSYDAFSITDISRGALRLQSLVSAYWV